ncbi:MAG: polysaccharide deacetylase family protein [Dehalococcoidia bacterium]|nr:MAG: polysaccharide deacetylase family protein [Dehalococcoidia bacterium]
MRPVSRALSLLTLVSAAVALGCSRSAEPAPPASASPVATETPRAERTPTPTPSVALSATAVPTAPTAAAPAARPPVAPPLPAPSGAVEIERGTRARKEVALTFDCGWRSDATGDILRILEEEDVVTTWFMMGIWAEAHPELTRRIAAKHELATHSWDHPDYRDLTDAQIAADLKRTDDYLRTFSGRSSAPIWRAPSAARDQRVMDAAARAGFPLHIFWTIEQTPAGLASGDSLDWMEIPAARVRSNLLRAIGLGGGAILVVHCDAEATRDVLREVIREYRKAGLQFVTVSQLLRP